MVMIIQYFPTIIHNSLYKSFPFIHIFLILPTFYLTNMDKIVMVAGDSKKSCINITITASNTNNRGFVFRCFQQPLHFP